jgi:uracil-DNA glycosylase family 4
MRIVDTDYNPKDYGCLCDQCPLNGRRAVGPEKNKNAKMVLLCESPGKFEAWSGTPLVGPTGEKVNQTLKFLGIPRELLHITNAIACMPPSDFSDADMKQAVSCCKPRLEKELKECEASYVFSCGKASLYALNGSVHQDHASGMFHDNALGGKIFLQAWHPTFVYFRNPALKPVFTTFLKRCWDTAQGSLSRWEWPVFKTELDLDALEILKKINMSPLPVSFDVETIPSKDIVTCVGLSNGEHTISIPWDTYSTSKWGDIIGLDGFNGVGREAKELVSSILKTHLIITQNGAYDVYEMKKKGLEFENGFDTMLAHAILWPQLRHGLEWAAIQYFPVPRWKSEFKAYSDEKGNDRWQEADPQVLRTYNARDTYMQWMLYAELKKALETFPHGMALYEDRMFQARLAAQSSQEGLPVSRDRIQEHRSKILELKRKPEMELKILALKSGFDPRKVEKEIKIRPKGKMNRKIRARFSRAPNYSIGGRYDYAAKWKAFNTASTQVMNKLFFEHYKCKPVRYSDSGKPSLDEKVLTAIISSNAESAPAKLAAQHMLKIRAYDKLLGTYLDGLEFKLDKDSVYHPDYQVHGPQTGRWGSFIHTIPKEVRDVFVAPPGYWIVEADFSQQELRHIALLSGDKPWLDAYKKGADIHALTAQELLGESNPKTRPLGKEFNLATNYCQADLEKAGRGVWEVLRVKFPDLELWAVIKFLKTKYKKHPRIKEWRESQVAMARELDYVECPFSGRRRKFWGQVEETEAYNFPVQAGGAYLMSNALRNVSEWIDGETHKLAIPNWHDAIYTFSKDPLECAHKLKASMEQVVEYKGNTMKFTVDVAIGRNLGNKIPLECFEIFSNKGSVEDCVARGVKKGDAEKAYKAWVSWF